MDDPEQKEQPIIPEELKDVLDQVSSVYVNNSYVNGTNWDVRITFGESLPSGKVVMRVGAVMSHQHAKALLDSLSKTIATLEAKFGTIKYGAKDSDKQK